MAIFRGGMWQAYANSQGVNIVGDIPIYVGGQSADVWANQGLFELEGPLPLRRGREVVHSKLQKSGPAMIFLYWRVSASDCPGVT